MGQFACPPVLLSSYSNRLNFWNSSPRAPIGSTGKHIPEYYCMKQIKTAWNKLKTYFINIDRVCVCFET